MTTRRRNFIEHPPDRTPAPQQSGWAAWYAAGEADERDRVVKSAPPLEPKAPEPAAEEAADVIAEAVRVTRSHGTYLVVKPCPLCGSKHAHGVNGPNLGDGDGWRVAHCSNGDGREYFVREVAATNRGVGE